METIKELNGWDFPDTIQEPDGYDLKSVPDITRRNFNLLIDEHNKLVAAYLDLAGRLILQARGEE